MIYQEDQEYSIDVNEHRIWHDTADDESAIILQFSGMKDKNNKEIYTGDILQILLQDNTLMTVVCKFGTIQRKVDTGWLVDIPCFYFLREDGLNSLPIVKNWQNKHDLETIEVIGNVYENDFLGDWEEEIFEKIFE